MFYFLRNLLAIVGLVVVIGAGYALVKLQPSLTAIGEFEDNAIDVFADMGVKLVETGNMAEASIWKIPVDEGMTAEEVEETMKFVANEHNFKNVGEMPRVYDLADELGFRLILTDAIITVTAIAVTAITFLLGK